MNKFFSFRENKFGWTQLIAVLALIVSICSPLYMSYQGRKNAEPRVIVEEDTPFTGSFYDDTLSKWRFFTYNRILITNKGGRTVTLIGMYPSKDLPVIIPSMSNTIVDKRISYSIFPLEEMKEDIIKDPMKLARFKNFGLERLSVLNIPIEPGKTIIKNYGIIFDTYSDKDRTADLLFFGLDLKFSEGNKYFYHRGYPIPPIK